MPGVRSTFWFTARRVDVGESDNSQLAAGTDDSTRRLGQALRVLIAGDNEVNRNKISDMVVALGHEVRSAVNVPEAIIIAEQYLPDVIVLDMRMPVMDGLEAAQHLRRYVAFCNIPIVALTVSVGPDSEKVCRAAGCVVFLTKPIQSDELVSVIASDDGEQSQPEKG